MQQFLKFLQEFESYGGKGIIYGGCLRDTVTGVGSIKDIDIATQNLPENHAAIDQYIAARQVGEPDPFLGYECQVLHQNLNGYGNFADVVVSIQVTNPGEPQINFIVLTDIVPFSMPGIASRCDFGICQIAMNSNGLLCKTPAFEADLAAKTFTYMKEPSVSQMERSRRRWDRFKGRYPEWTAIFPEPDYSLISEAA